MVGVAIVRTLDDQQTALQRVQATLDSVVERLIIVEARVAASDSLGATRPANGGLVAPLHTEAPPRRTSDSR